MASSTPDAAATLEYTPTWVVALVCSIIVIISLCAERFLHYLGKYLKRNQQPALFEALLKLKEELMLLGFISLLLTVFQGVISNICISASLSSHMLPCKREESSATDQVHKRLLSEGSGSGYCLRQGKIPLLSIEALHQLHIFIFVLAVVHVIFCATTMIQRWKHWEDSIRNENIKTEKSNDLLICAHAHLHVDFVAKRGKGHWRKTAVIGWTMSFFKQFHASVTKSDYIALRSGFIMKHCRSNSNFDFHKYMMRTLEADFKKVVGVSWYLWLFVVFFLLLNVDGWHTYFWLSLLPLILLLAVGAKLEHIITRLAQEAAAQRTDDAGGMPGIVLYLIHFILFQNSFEIAFFFWILSTYGFDSCIMEEVRYLVPRLIIGVIIQGLCSYSTLPLYAIVTQMGDNFKRQIFDEQVQDKIQGWAMSAKGRKKSQAGLSSVFKGFLSRKTEDDASVGGPRNQIVSESAHSAQHTVNVGEIVESVSENSDLRPSS
ncbi:unnamed protein product [Spirodela intermedia]|uniref:MLO-like protein n=1 Tax=Spirodela intermedia TaxID=51605 RepID=A0A7I8JL65_SPIIN|nr:unnamed protein product [Spirodela intermedia]CAA6670800.1 unnamed protein product [Spirodela intermedia]